MFATLSAGYRRVAVGGATALAAVGLIASQTATPSQAAGPIAVDCDAGGSLAQAVGQAQAGVTILVAGTCNESVRIPRALTGIILDGQGAATIQGPAASSPATSPAAFSVFVEATGVTVRNFTIRGGAHAVHLSGPATATIEHNTIRDSGGGVHLDKGSIGQILDNEIVANAYGINLQEDSYARIGFRIPTIAQAPGNIIRENTGPGISIKQRSSAVIVGNTISDNVGDGISVTRASQADVMGNEIGGNGGNGVTVRFGSGVNFSGEDTGRPNDGPNTSATPNGQVGVSCSVGGYVAGPLGSLAGARGPAQANKGCSSDLDR